MPESTRSTYNKNIPCATTCSSAGHKSEGGGEDLQGADEQVETQRQARNPLDILL